MTSSQFALLMRDAAKLLRPANVVSLSTSASHSSVNDLINHPSINALLALSDLSSLFHPMGTAHDTLNRSIPHPCTAKLTFYAARVFHTPSYVLTALCNEASVRASFIEREGVQNKDQGSMPSGEPGPTVNLGRNKYPEYNLRPHIQELS